MREPRCTPVTGYRALIPRMFPAVENVGPPHMRAPMTYVIDYSRRYLDDPSEIRAFAGAPPDLMHVGKSVPILHNWGPVPLIHGENQATGGPNHTLDRDAVRLLTPGELKARIERLKRYTRQWHEAGVPRLMCYSAIHTIAGDHETREGFWNFYDHWQDYEQWLGPKPGRDPFEWLSVDRDGNFLEGSCGGFTPPYLAPLHRYRTCPEHPDWRRFQAALTRLIAEAGYDGVFPDNSSSWEIQCVCAHCRRSFKEFAAALAPRDRRGFGTARGAKDADLLSESTPRELIRRYRIATIARWQLMVRDAGREVNPRFEVFPNVNSYADFMAISASCDVLMFESTYPPGTTLPAPRLRKPVGVTAAKAYSTHVGQLLFTVHSPARTVLLDYGCRKPGKEAVQELGLAQCAAFSNGGAIAGSGEPLKKYHRFFKRSAALYEGSEPYADVGLLYSYWGHNPGGMWRPDKQASPAEALASRQRLIRTVMDRTIGESELASLKTLVLCGHALEMTDAQIAAITRYAGRGGTLCVYKPETTVNGKPLAEFFGPVAQWTPRLELPGHRPVIEARGLSRGLRFNAFLQPDRLRLVLHAVNYNVNLQRGRASVLPVPKVPVRLPLPEGWEALSVTAHSPGEDAARPLRFAQRARILRFALPPTTIYRIVEVVAGRRPRSDRGVA